MNTTPARPVYEYISPSGQHIVLAEVAVERINIDTDGHGWRRSVTDRRRGFLGKHAQDMYDPRFCEALILKECVDGRYDVIDHGAVADLARRSGVHTMPAWLYPATLTPEEEAEMAYKRHLFRRDPTSLRLHYMGVFYGEPVCRAVTEVAQAHGTPIAPPFRRAESREIVCPDTLKMIYQKCTPPKGQRDDVRIWREEGYRLNKILDVIVAAWDKPTPEQQDADIRLTQALRATMFQALNFLYVHQDANVNVDDAHLATVLARETNPTALIARGHKVACEMCIAGVHVTDIVGLCRVIEESYNATRGPRQALHALKK